MVGICSHVTQDGLLAVDIENIVLNVPPSSQTAADEEDEEGKEGSGSKKRKFCAFATKGKSAQKRCAPICFRCSLFFHFTLPQ